jgi:hypothetical protein
MPDNNPVKPFWKSKTCLLNAVVAAVAVFSDWGGNPTQVVSALALANIVLRYFTSTGITASLR